MKKKKELEIEEGTTGTKDFKVKDRQMWFENWKIDKAIAWSDRLISQINYEAYSSVKISN